MLHRWKINKMKCDMIASQVTCPQLSHMGNIWEIIWAWAIPYCYQRGPIWVSPFGKKVGKKLWDTYGFIMGNTIWVIYGYI